MNTGLTYVFFLYVHVIKKENLIKKFYDNNNKKKTKTFKDIR